MQLLPPASPPAPGAGAPATADRHPRLAGLRHRRHRPRRRRRHEHADHQPGRRRRSGHAARAAAAALPQGAKEDVVIRNPRPLRTTPRLRSRRPPTSCAGCRGSRRCTTVRRGPISRDRHSALVSFTIPGDETQVKTRVAVPLAAVAAAAQAHPASGSRRPATPAAAGNRAELRAEPRQGGVHVAAADARHPDLRLRRARRRRPAAAARDHRRRRDARPRRPAEPAGPGRPAHQRRDPAHRPRRRRRLPLFYLKRVREERAAGRRTPRRSRRRRRPPDAPCCLGPHRDDRHGRHVPRGPPTFVSLATGTILVVAVSDARLAVGPAGRAVGARRSRREGPHPVRSAASSASGARCGPRIVDARAAPAGGLGHRQRGRAARARLPGAET